MNGKNELHIVTLPLRWRRLLCMGGARRGVTWSLVSSDRHMLQAKLVLKVSSLAVFVSQFNPVLMQRYDA